MAKKKTKSAPQKATAKQRTLNPAKAKKAPAGVPFNDQDTKRRLGNFTTAGEHARQGGRTTGIVGQTKQKNSTDKKQKKG